MSMLASIARISQTDIEAILLDPGCVGDLLDSPETPKELKPGFFARIFLGRRSPSQVSAKRIPVLKALSYSELFDLSGYWHITDADLYWQPGSTPEDRTANLENLWGVVGEIR